MVVNAPTLSVITTLYNREKYIAETIESVLSSSFTDFEYIILDDRSSDNSFEIAKTYEKIDPRVKVVKNDINLGDYPNRNKAASLAKGKYLKFLDADDVLYNHGLQVMVESMQAFPQAGYGICTKHSHYEKYPIQVNSYEALKQHFITNGPLTLSCSPGSAIILKEAFDKVGGFRINRHISDALLWRTLSLHYPVVKMITGLYWWRGHEQQESKIRLKNRTPIIEEYLANTEIITNIDSPLSKDEQSLAIAKLKHKLARKILVILIKEKDFRGAYKLLQDANLDLSNVLSGFKG